MRALGLLYSLITMEASCNEEFTKRKELARQQYWDACKFPRKTKKRMRKEAKADFELYSMLEKPLIYNW